MPCIKPDETCWRTRFPYLATIAGVYSVQPQYSHAGNWLPYGKIWRSLKNPVQRQSNPIRLVDIFETINRRTTGFNWLGVACGEWGREMLWLWNAWDVGEEGAGMCSATLWVQYGITRLRLCQSPVRSRVYVIWWKWMVDREARAAQGQTFSEQGYRAEILCG